VPSWGEDSTQLRRNLRGVLDEIALAAGRREAPAVAAARRWHTRLMRNLAVPDARWVGALRGEPGLERVEVQVGAHSGVPAVRVAGELRRFERRLKKLVREMDRMLPVGQQPDADRLAAVIDLCAWVHAEWVRIHPFANGSGRTARLWANSVAMRYGLPPFIRLRPRPDDGYADAGSRAMQGDWTPTAAVFRRMLAHL
jgi:fido (protein-threonine AMPylation protein)